MGVRRWWASLSSSSAKLSSSFEFKFEFAALILFACFDGRVVRASTSGTVDLGLIPRRIKPIALKLVFTASLLDAQHYKDSVKNKLASLLVVPLGKALCGIPPSSCGRQMAGNS